MFSQALELPCNSPILHHTSVMHSFGHTLDPALPVSTPSRIQNPPIPLLIFPVPSFWCLDSNSLSAYNHQFLHLFSATPFPVASLLSSPSLLSMANHSILPWHPPSTPVLLSLHCTQENHSPEQTQFSICSNPVPAELNMAGENTHRYHCSATNHISLVRWLSIFTYMDINRSSTIC